MVRFCQLTKVRWLQFRLQIQIDPVLESPRNERLLDLAEDLQLLSVDVPLPLLVPHGLCTVKVTESGCSVSGRRSRCALATRQGRGQLSRVHVPRRLARSAVQTVVAAVVARQAIE